MSMSYVKLFYDWPEATAMLSDAERGRLAEAMVRYARGERDGLRLEGNEQFLFPAYAAQLDRDAQHYRSACARDGSRRRKSKEKEEDKEEEKEWTRTGARPVALALRWHSCCWMNFAPGVWTARIPPGPTISSATPWSVGSNRSRSFPAA